jgi:galactonate dehydratase
VIISRVRLFQVTLPEDTWIWLAVETGDGRCGWGECWSSGWPSTALGAWADAWAARLAGRDPRRLAEARAERPDPPGRAGGPAATVASAIDQALWDLYAQAWGVPLAVALGGFGRTTIPLYANLNRGLRRDRSPEALAARGAAAHSAGFAVVKCAPFDEVRPDTGTGQVEAGLARLYALAEKVPWDRIAIDCHERFTGRLLVALLDALPGTPYWMEDPLAPPAWRDWRWIRERHPMIRWAAGERTETWTALERLRRRGVDVLMPDLTLAGGVSPVRAWITVWEDLGGRLSLHNPWGPIATAHAAHVMATSRGDVPLEWAWGVTPRRATATIPREPVRAGHYVIPSTPGIGIAPDPAFLSLYAQEWTAEGWRPVSPDAACPSPKED